MERTGGHPLPEEPILPIFTQLNLRFANQQGDLCWKESSR